MKEDFKNIIKQTVDNHSDDINPDMIWSGIEDKIGQKKKRFAGFWVFSGLILLAFLFLTALYWTSTEEIQNSTSLNYVSVDGDEVERKVESERNVLDQNLRTKEKSKVKVNKSESKDKLNSINLSNEEIVGIQNDPITRLTEKVRVESITNDSEKRLGYEDNIEISVQRTSDVNSSTFKSFELENISNATQNRTISTINVDELTLLEFSNLPQVKRDEVLLESEPLDFESQTFRKVKKIKFLSGIEFFSGLSFGNKSVSDINQSYAQIRNESEQLLEQWNAGIRLDLIKVLDFNISSGLKYSMITDRVLKVDEYQNLKEFTLVTSRLVDDAIVSMDTTMVRDSLGNNYQFTTEQYNSQRIISIPLEISFGKRFNRFDIGIGFGIDVNYQLKDTHVILNEEGKAVINKVGGKWISPSFGGSLLLGYYLNEKWSLSSRLNFRGLTLNDHETIPTLNSKYSLYGIELGLKRSF